MGLFSIDEYTCADCTNCDLADRYCGKVRCNHYCEYVDANKYANDCYGFLKSYSRQSSDANGARDYSQSYNSGGGCYITTITCDILAMKDDNVYLNTLRKFRNDYLQKNEKGLEILVKYDFIGPQIKEMLLSDSSKFSVAYTLFNNFIVPTVASINDYDYEKAINIYTDMTKKLMTYYGIEDVVDVKIDEVEPTLSGHGRIQKKIS